MDIELSKSQRAWNDGFHHLPIIGQSFPIGDYVYQVTESCQFLNVTSLINNVIRRMKTKGVQKVNFKEAHDGCCFKLFFICKFDIGLEKYMAAYLRGTQLQIGWYSSHHDLLLDDIVFSHHNCIFSCYGEMSDEDCLSEATRSWLDCQGKWLDVDNLALEIAKKYSDWFKNQKINDIF